MAGSGTAAWMPKRPEQAPASVSGPRFASPKGRSDGVAERERSTHGRATRPFRFGSEDRPDPDPPLDAGALVGERYRIIGLLGEGGMGRVYEAEHTVLSRRVALKLLRRDAQAQAENLARFQQEALAASRIGTPQIVEIVDFASHTGPAGVQTYMVMELLAGESLEDWMERSEPLDVGVELLAQLCDGLAAAHRAGVIHRDIKPANVFCQPPDRHGQGGPNLGCPRVKILDFGIAKMTAGGQGVQTQQGSLLGTPYYLAPERVMGVGSQLTPAADVYSVGVILYEMLTGNVPFVADSFMGILARHVHTEPLDPRQAAPERGIPDSIAGWCMRLLSKQPNERPSAAELAVELRGLLARERGLLAGVRVGPREGTASAGEDTQVLTGMVAAGEPEHAISERPTLPPTTHGVAGATRVEPASRGRSGTAIGHAAVAAETSTVVLPQQVPSSTRPQRASAAPVIAAVVIVLLGGLGFGAYLLWRSQQSPTPAVSEDVPVVEAPVVAAPELPPTPNVEPLASELIAAEPAPAEPSPPEPIGDSSSKPAAGTVKQQKPAPELAPAEPEPEPKPEPPPEPPASEPDPAPAGDPNKQVDPQLPTIKDDVYE